jgi:[acyl-carrier-protein] S-malonyltransferase
MLKVAIVFPGQGSQSVGMLHELANTYRKVQEMFDIASTLLGYDVWELVQHGPETRLAQTEHTQVAMLVSDIAVFEILKQEGLTKASMMAGHSLGEYAALVASEVLTLSAAVLLVSRRGQLMQKSIPLGQGAMAAIVGLNDDDVAAICREASDSAKEVSPANFNTIGQVVIAGHTPAVLKAMSLAEAKGARLAKMIPVSVPCHCALLNEASTDFLKDLEAVSFAMPKVPVVSNVDLSFYQTSGQMRTLLSQQLCKPVRWVETIQLMKQQGVNYIIECGPGKVLSGLIKRIDSSIQTISVNDKSSLDKVLLQLKGA